MPQFTAMPHSREVGGSEMSSEFRNETTWTPPLPTGADLARQLAAVVADLPRFVVAPLRRRRCQTWGATAAEVTAAMPGDDLLPRAQYRSTRAITIAAPP